MSLGAVSLTSPSLIIALGDHAPTRASPQFAVAVTSLVTASEHPRDASRLLGTAADALDATARRELDLLPAKDQLWVAAALFVLGELILTERGNFLAGKTLRAAASLFDASSRSQAGRSPEDLLQQDRLLGSTIFLLQGWVSDSGFTQGQKRRLGQALTRMGLLSGIQSWLSHEIRLPRLRPAFAETFGVPEPPAAERLSPPSSYFEAALRWLPEPLGPLQLVLSKFLDESMEASLKAGQDFRLATRESAVIRSARDRLLRGRGEPPQQVFEDLVRIASMPFYEAERETVTLPAFLRRSL